MSFWSGRGPERVGDILKERIVSLGWGPRLREEEVLVGWTAAVGPRIAAHARPSHIVDRRLTVVTENPVWTQQLSFLKSDLLRRIALRFGPDAVTDLYFVTGKIEAQEPPAPPPEPRAPETIVLDPALEEELGSIRDPGVRDAVRGLMLAARLADAEGPEPPA